MLSLSGLMGTSCTKDAEKGDPVFALPPETQTGANTFGCIVNNQVFYPRDGQGSLFVGGSKGLTFWGDHTLGQNLYNEIKINNAKDGKPCSNMIIHLQGLDQIGVGVYIWKITNFQNNIDGMMHNYVYAKIYDAATDNWKYYGSYENSGKVTITRFDLPNRICSGNFNGKLRLYNGTAEIEIINGRFDLKWDTLNTTSFP